MLILLAAAALVLLVLNVCIGSINISLAEVLQSISGNGTGTFTQILWSIRLPRALATLILGGALALVGYLLQTFFYNPIAGPFVLGISSGAKMVVAVVMVFLLGRSIRVSSAGMILAAFSEL